MTIRFLLSGGTAPWVQYLPVTVNTAPSSGAREESGSSSKKSSSDSDSKLTDKDLLSILKEIDGLPSDMDLMYKELVMFMRTRDAEDLDTSALAVQFIRSQKAIKTAIYRKELFDKVYDQVKTNGGLHEFAINDTGKLVGMNDKGEIKLLSLNELKDSEYKPLTNAQLLLLRAENINYANNDVLTNIASNGIGLEKVNDIIHKFVNNFGKTIIGAASNLELSVNLGIEYVYKLAESGIDPEDFIGNTVLTESQTEQAQYALRYIFNMLPDNAKTLLSVKALEISQASGKEVTPASIVYDLIASKMSSKYNIGARKSGSNDKNGKSESDINSDVTSDQYSNISRGVGYGGTGTFKLMDSDGYSMSITGKSYPYIQGQDGNNIETMTLSKALQKGLGSIYKGSNYAITFGDLELKPEDLHGVLYESDGSVMRVILPVKEKDGKIVPDLDVAKEHKDLIDAINNSPNGLNDPKVQKLLKESKLFNDYNGELDLSLFLEYIVANGKSDSQTVQISDWLHEIDPSDNQISIYNKYLQEENPDYEFDKNSWYNPFDWGDLHDKMYEGTIFIPITENVLAASTGMKKDIKLGSANKLELGYLNSEFKRYNQLTLTNDINERLDNAE